MPNHNEYPGYHDSKLAHDVEINSGPKVMCPYCTNIFYPGPMLTFHHLRFHYTIAILINMNMSKGREEKVQIITWIKRTKKIKIRIRRILKWLNLPLGIPLTTRGVELEDSLSILCK